MVNWIFKTLKNIKSSFHVIRFWQPTIPNQNIESRSKEPKFSLRDIQISLGQHARKSKQYEDQ